MKLSKGSLVLLHQVRLGQVWRDNQGFWVIASGQGKRNVHLRLIALENRAMVSTDPKSHFPVVTQAGMRYLEDNPVP